MSSPRIAGRKRHRGLTTRKRLCDVMGQRAAFYSKTGNAPQGISSPHPHSHPLSLRRAQSPGRTFPWCSILGYYDMDIGKKRCWDGGERKGWKRNITYFERGDKLLLWEEGKTHLISIVRQVHVNLYLVLDLLG